LLIAKKPSLSAPRIGLESISLDDLWSLHEEISSVLSARIEAEKLELEKRLAAIHRSMASPEEQTGAASMPVAKRRRKYRRVLPKYRNPQSPSETWAGRGKLPRWLVAAIKSGRGLEEFRITDANVSKERQKA
jgi:DNA-binding protein H-NS